MKFRARKTIRIWPLFFTFTQSGFSSWGVKIWRYTFNVTRKTSSFDTPGIGYVRHQHGGSRGRNTHRSAQGGRHG